MSSRATARVVRANPTDPRFRGLPFGDGKTRRFVVNSPTEEVGRWSENLLGVRGWAVHRVGGARYAHGPNGARWIFAVLTPEGVPPSWLGRLAAPAPVGGP